MKSSGLMFTGSISSSSRCNFFKNLELLSGLDSNRDTSTQHGSKPNEAMLGGGVILPVSPNKGVADRIGPFNDDVINLDGLT